MKRGQLSKFDALTDSQREQLILWLTAERLSYAKARERVREKFGVNTSRTAMHGFWNRECQPYLLRQSKLKGAFLDIRVRVRQGEKVVGETEFSIALADPAAMQQQSSTGAAGLAFHVETEGVRT